MPRLLDVRPFQRLLLVAIECRGADCLTTSPLVVGPHLPLPLDVWQMVEGYFMHCLVEHVRWYYSCIWINFHMACGPY